MNDYELVNEYINSNLKASRNLNTAVSNLQNLENYLRVSEIGMNYSLLEQLLNENKIFISSLKTINDHLIKHQESVIGNDFIDSCLDYYLSLKVENNSSYPKPLSKEEEVQLFEEYKKGNLEARKTIIEHNLRLVQTLARRYAFDQEIGDIFQEGCIGLFKAVEKFDVTKGYKFSSYATWWIRQAINRAKANFGRTIRYPVHMVDDINNFKKTESSLSYLGNGSEKLEAIASSLGISLEKARMLQKYANLNTISLSVQVGEDETLETFLADSTNIEDEVESNVLHANILKMLNESSLTEKEKKIIMLRYGLVDGECYTLEKVGAMFHLTRERIRQIEKKALKKLSREVSNDLEIYLREGDISRKRRIGN